jgi:hypothetical protein
LDGGSLSRPRHGGADLQSEQQISLVEKFFVGLLLVICQTIRARSPQAAFVPFFFFSFFLLSLVSWLASAVYL